MFDETIDGDSFTGIGARTARMKSVRFRVLI
uniref:Uncharacterized protein n=1 Tax=Arabidopsis thaliana TaxID=3702 RepID=Q56W34_ARATH|nr:hypothetical protein [Arabidopsis thaliana]